MTLFGPGPGPRKATPGRRPSQGGGPVAAGVAKSLTLVRVGEFAVAVSAALKAGFLHNPAIAFLVPDPARHRGGH